MASCPAACWQCSGESYKKPGSKATFCCLALQAFDEAVRGLAVGDVTELKARWLLFPHCLLFMLHTHSEALLTS